jgi:hypothetical protein
MGIPHVLGADQVCDLDDDFPSCHADEQMLLQTLLFPSTLKDSRIRQGTDHVTTRSRATPTQPCTHRTSHVHELPVFSDGLSRSEWPMQSTPRRKVQSHHQRQDSGRGLCWARTN